MLIKNKNFTAMRIAKYDYEAMPRETRNLYLLMMDKTAGGQTAFAQEIDVRQQTLTRLFRPDPRNGRYPAIPRGQREGLPTLWPGPVFLSC